MARGRESGAVVPWWIAFLVLTIAGERLELTRLLPPSPARERQFALIVAAVLAGAALALVHGEAGWRVFGIALLALAAWLGVQDIARRTAREPGLTGYIGRSLLSGYVWLAIGGALLAGPGASYGGLAWDAAVHAILLGFVFSMVFGHAPLVVPAIARTSVPIAGASTCRSRCSTSRSRCAWRGPRGRRAAARVGCDPQRDRDPRLRRVDPDGGRAREASGANPLQ